MFVHSLSIVLYASHPVDNKKLTKTFQAWGTTLSEQLALVAKEREQEDKI